MMAPQPVLVADAGGWHPPISTVVNPGGMIGVRNIPQRGSSSCFVMMRIEHGKYVRQYPAKKGTLDCDPKGSVTIKADYSG